MAIYGLGEHVPTIDPCAYIHPDAIVIGSVSVAAGATVWPMAVLRGDSGFITVGTETSVQDGTVVHATPQHPTRIGARNVVGHSAHLEGCTTGEDCLIGSGAIVLKQAVIEDGAGVGAAALVAQGTVVPTGYIALGVPARIRPAPEMADLVARTVAAYLSNGALYRQELRRLD